MINIDKEKLIESYRINNSTRIVANEFDVSHEYIRCKLKELGVLNKPITKYACNDNFFSSDTQESFYWAGFIAADGCVKLKDNKYKQLSIGLNNIDHNHLEKFKHEIGFMGPIGIIKRIDCIASEICISSDKIFDDLERFGIVPRKSLILKFPEWLINHELVNHFMRGYNDGDGSFYTQCGQNRKIYQLYFSLRGTKEFLTVYRDILEKNCNFIHNEKKPRPNSGIYMLEYGGNNKVKEIANFLYKDSVNNIRLDRKYNIVYGD